MTGQQIKVFGVHQQDFIILSRSISNGKEMRLGEAHTRVESKIIITIGAYNITLCICPKIKSKSYCSLV